jgi:alpha-tubulin suppressor-like RCC1 family protein
MAVSGRVRFLVLGVAALLGLQALSPASAAGNDPPASSPSPSPSAEQPPTKAGPTTEEVRDTVLPYGSSGYRYKVVTQGALPGFEAPTYDDVAAGFSDGTAPFANDTCAGPYATAWTGTTDLLLRRTINLPPGSQDVRVSVAIDNDIQVWWNGVDVSGGLVISEGCAVPDEYTFVVPAWMLETGDNLLAARARNRHSSSRVDLKVTTAPFVPIPTSCANEVLSASLTPEPSLGERVTVWYDPRFLVAPGASADYAADAARIAREIKARAEDALDYYDDPLGFDTPPNVTIEIRCQLRLEVLGDIPAWYVDAPGYTGDWDDVQLRSDEIRNDFAPAVIGPRLPDGSFTPGTWQSPPAPWASTVDHEMFHTVQHWPSSNLMGAKYLLGADTANIESAATLAQDLFADADDDGADIAGSYWRQVRLYYDQPVPLTADMSGLASYRLAPVLQYLGEQYGSFDLDPDYELNVANFLRRLIVSDRTRIEAIEDAMFSGWDTVAEGLRDFVIAAYANDRPSWEAYPEQYQVADEAHSYLATDVGTDYSTFNGVTPETPDNDLTFGGSVSETVSLGEGEGYVFEVDLAPNVLLAQLSLGSYGPTGGRRPAVAVLPVNPDGSVQVFPDYLPRWVVRGEYREPIVVPVAGLTKLAVVVAITSPATLDLEPQTPYVLTATDVSNAPGIRILPESQGPISIGAGPDFDPFQIIVEPTSNYVPIGGLSGRAFAVTIGGLPAEVRSGARMRPDGSYALVVQPPAALAPGSHDLRVTLANLTYDTAPDAIIVESGGGMVQQSATGSGVNGFLHVESLGEVGTPLQIRYPLADRTGPIAGATVTATLTDPLGVVRSATLVDDGGHDDGAPADGIYGASIWSTDAEGLHSVQLTATGLDSGGTPFELQAAATASLAAKVDADLDGVADVVEPWFQLDPGNGGDSSLDNDDDGLTIATELALGSDPYAADTDRGGEADGSEQAAGRNPLSAVDDQPVPTPVVSVRTLDGNVLSVYVGTEDGSGTVRLSRVQDGVVTDLGTHPGAADTVIDGPLASGEYSYRAVAVGTSGGKSAPVMVGPAMPVGDATPPDAFLVVNDGVWQSAASSVALEFNDLSETPTEMRLAESPESLEMAPWVPFASQATYFLEAIAGPHIVHAQVMDSAGNVSRTLSAVIDLVDRTPPTSVAGPLEPSYTTPTVEVPFTATDDITGVNSVDLWSRYRPVGGSWGAWTLGPTSSTSPITFTFGSAAGGTYEFYTIAVDVAGNREAAPDVADASTEGPDLSPTWAWGSNEGGQLGAASSETCYSDPCSSVPLQVHGLPDVIEVAAGTFHSVALRADGTVWTWGYNGYGSLGVGQGITESPTPIQVPNLSEVVSVEAEGTCSYAVKSDGTLWAWGRPWCQIVNYTSGGYTPAQVGDLTNVVAVACGQDHTLVLQGNGVLLAFGLNEYGSLGDNTTTPRTDTPVETLISDVVSIAAGDDYSIAVKADGTVWSWGLNDIGQLGLGHTRNQKRPQQVSGLTSATTVAAGPTHAFAILQDASLWAWGSNGWGQLGDGTTTYRLRPVRVPNLNGLAAISAGSGHSIALTTDGSLWGWGYGAYGQLDSGSTSGQIVPTRMAASLGTFVAIAAGDNHTLAVLASP